MSNILKQWWEENKNNLLLCLAATFIIGLAAHAFQFLNFQYAHDSLDGLYVLGRENAHKVELGRIFAPVYRYFFGGNFSVPWLIGFMSLLWIALAAFFVVNSLDIKSKPMIALTCGVMAVNINVIGLAATFMHDLDIDMFSMMLACLGVYIWKTRLFGRFWLLFGAAAVCGSMGMYQSFISVAIVLIMLVLLCRIVSGADTHAVIKDTLGALAMGAGGCVMYAAALKVTPRLTGIALTGRNSLTALFGLSFGEIANLVKAAYVKWFEYFVYFKSNWASVKITAVLHIVLMAALVVLAVVLAAKNSTSLLCKLAAAAIVVTLPLAMNIMRVVSVVAYHDLMKYAFVFLYIGVFALGEKSGVRAAQLVPLFCTAVVVFASVQAANELYLKRHLAYDATMTRMAFVLHDMELAGYVQPSDSKPEFDRVLVEGNIRLHYYREFENLDDIKDANVDNAVTSDPKSIEHYFRYVLGCWVEFCSDSEAAAIRDTEAFENMPVYPQEGYIQYINDVMVVKLN